MTENEMNEELPCRLVLQPQEPALDDPQSCCFFRLGPGQELRVTPAALFTFTAETITACLFRLQHLARKHQGLDYLQVFEDPETHDVLWFIDDGPGVVTALLPEDY